MRRFRFKIVQFMKFAAIVALGLAMFRAFSPGGQRIGPEPALEILGWIFLISSFLPVILLLGRNPLKDALADPPEYVEEQIAHLVRGLSSRHWRFRRPHATATARYRLIILYTSRKQYAEAIEQGRVMLRMAGLRCAWACQARVEIASCLDCLGRGVEAEAERKIAAEVMRNPSAEPGIGTTGAIDSSVGRTMLA